MAGIGTPRRQVFCVLVIFMLALLSSCNLGRPRERVPGVEITRIPEVAASIPSLTPARALVVSTPSLPTAVLFPTVIPALPTQIFIPPTAILLPSPTSLPTSIFIRSPLPNREISGNTQILGSAIHPAFLQYRVEYATQPNPQNLWYPITGAVQIPASNTGLGVWNTANGQVPDGVYQIRLRVFLLNGGEQNIVVSTIHVQNQGSSAPQQHTLPNSEFTLDIESGYAPHSVRFTGPASDAITSYDWNFGDGNSSSAQSPTHTFTVPGQYSVTLTVYGPGGSSSFVRHVGVVAREAPVARFEASPVQGQAPLEVQFTNNTTGEVDSYQWSFGDGGTSSESSPVHTFQDTGAYDIELAATGPGGRSRYVRQIVVADPQSPPPVASFTAEPLEGLGPLTVSFSNTSVDADNGYTWDFGDVSLPGSSDIHPTVTFNAPGVYTVTLMAAGSGGSDTASVDITVYSPPPPTAAFQASTFSGFVPLSVVFTNQSSGEITTYEWDFQSDGVVDSYEDSPLFTFEVARIFVVMLRAIGPGGMSEATAEISVTAAVQPPSVGFDSTVSDLTVSFVSTAIGDDLTYSWDFGDGNTSSDPNPIHTYTTAGNYSVSQTVLNAGGSDAASVDISVDTPPPLASAFQSSVSSGLAPLSVIFTNQSSGEVTTFEWDFQSDGVVDSYEVSPLFTFEVSGTFVVKLRAIGPGGFGETSTEIAVTQALPTPSAGFEMSVSDLTVSFVSTAIGEDLSYIWTFGDSNSSSDPNPVHTFGASGSYSVTQAVFNAGGENTHVATVEVSALLQPLTAPAGQIAFVTDRDGNNEIYNMDADGSNAINLTNHLANDRHPSWSPDGSTIAFASRRDDDIFDIYKLEVASNMVTRLTSQGSNTRPVWSPNGSKIAFVSDRFGDKDVMVMNADGTGQIQLTVDVHSDDQPTWSPDGNSIAYVSDENWQRDIYVMSSTDGSRITTLASGAGDNFQPSWLNMSGLSLLAFTSTRFGNEDIFVIDPVSGEELRQITSEASVERQPSWSADGALILFVSDRANGVERNIYSVTPDGANFQRLTPDGSNDREPKWK